MLRDQVEPRRAIVPRISGVVHPDETDDSERHGAHRFERAKGDATDEKSRAALVAGERLLEIGHEYVERHRFVETG